MDFLLADTFIYCKDSSLRTSFKNYSVIKALVVHNCIFSCHEESWSNDHEFES